MIQTAERLNGIGEYYFSAKLREIEKLNREGKRIISLGIGSPDQPPHPDVIRVLNEERVKPNVHSYQSYKGSPVLRKAMAAWYRQWYGVELDPDQEILPLAGSKEGIMHICMTYVNAGDLVLIPNPGYPTYRSAAGLAGGNVIAYLLTEKNNWLPDFEDLKTLLTKKRAGQEWVLMFVNYPQMPTGQLPDKKLFEELVSFARTNRILLVHDNPYSFILNEEPLSMLQVEGAKDQVIELNSLSKSHNMAGWRVGMLMASRERIDEVLRFKSNMDSGMFLPVQLAAAKALSLPASWYSEVNSLYRKRRMAVEALLDEMGCRYSKKQAGMFVWARIPETVKDGYSLSDLVLYEAGVFITPGGIFGSAGDEYVRVSLCASEENILESIGRIKQAGILKSKQHV
ncbi:MAG: aminotransferase class I/II-fold pyridoxal phosphate-dependent enzyme [Bacteroidota bacterium]|nr:aminotransferase class I/II-fold pyridoxal phosphate-dependent enzyme [Bacteroidota bacterium]